MKINEAYKEKGECLIDLEMKKKIIDNLKYKKKDLRIKNTKKEKQKSSLPPIY